MFKSLTLDVVNLKKLLMVNAEQLNTVKFCFNDVQTQP
jgi:hypothetical protein